MKKNLLHASIVLGLISGGISRANEEAPVKQARGFLATLMLGEATRALLRVFERSYDVSPHNANKLRDVNRFIAAGADVNARNENDSTALILAAKSGEDYVVAMLIAAGADVNAQDTDGGTALTWATAWGYDAIVARLIAAGADVNAQNTDGYTALSLAILKKHNKIAQMIQDEIDRKKRQGAMGFLHAYESARATRIPDASTGLGDLPSGVAEIIGKMLMPPAPRGSSADEDAAASAVGTSGEGS